MRRMADRSCNSPLTPEARERIRKAWPKIIREIAAGSRVAATWAKHGIAPHEKRAWLAHEPGTKAEWDEAREESADAFMDLAMNEAMANYDKESAQHVRTRIDTLKWAARIRNPRLYGDRQAIDMTVKSVDLTRVIQDAQARLVAARQPRVIEGEVSRPQIAQAIESVALRAVEQSALAAHNAERDVDSLM